MTDWTYPVVKITDAGHGWLRVDPAEYPDAGEYASGCSPTVSGLVYLEQNDDAPAFLKAHPSVVIEATFDVDEINDLVPGWPRPRWSGVYLRRLGSDGAA